MDIRRSVPFTIETQIEKYLEINLTKKNIYEKTCKTWLFKVIGQDLNKWKRCTKFLGIKIFTTKTCQVP